MNRRQRRELKRAPMDLREALKAAGPKPIIDHAASDEMIEASAAALLAWLRRRTAITETWRKRSRLGDPQLLQERHSPTVEIAVDDPAGKRRTRRNWTRVRQSEAWRHNNLDSMQRQAEAELLAVWTQRTAGLQTHGLRLDRVGPGTPPAFDDARAIQLDRTWLDWVREAPGRGIDVAAFIMLLTEPRTLVEVERACRMARGEAFEAYRQGLDLWAKLRGWLRAPVGGIAACG